MVSFTTVVSLICRHARQTTLAKKFCSKSLLHSVLIASTAMSVAIVLAGPAQLGSYELSGVVITENDAIAVVFNTNQQNELILREGDYVAGCVVDYIRRSRVNFYCDEQVRTLSLRSLEANRDRFSSQVVWASPVAISAEDKSVLFDKSSDFVEQLNLIPYLEDGKQAALKIEKVRTAAVGDKLDLKAGDLIISVNGISAIDESQLPQAFEQIKYSQTIDLELIREGTRYYKSYLLADN